MRTRDRLTRLETNASDVDQLPQALLATTPIPGGADNVTDDQVRRWLRDGEAHIGFAGATVIYDGGEIEMTGQEWLDAYQPEDILQ